MTSSDTAAAAARSTSTSDNGEQALSVEVQRDSNVRATLQPPNASRPTALRPVADSCGSHELSQVWFEFLDPDQQSAIPVRWADLQRHGDTNALVYRPGEGLDGWTPVADVLREEERRSTVGEFSRELASGPAPSASAPASSSTAEQPAAEFGRGRVRPLPQSSSTGSAGSGSTNGPTNLQRGISVTVDPVTGGLVGLPEQWKGLVPEGCLVDVRNDASVPEELRAIAPAQQGVRLQDQAIVGRPYNVRVWKPSFGVPLEACELIRINGFQIPKVLEEVSAALRERNGLLDEGIFRLAPNGTECERAKAALNGECSQASLAQVADPHVLANLIKIWFRSMPSKLLSVVSPQEITECQTGAQCMQVLQRFPPGNKGVMLWLLDLMADVADGQEHNKMSEAAISIVMAPNLYDAPPSEDPLDALLHTQKMTKFLSELLHHYMTVRKRVRSNSVTGSAPIARNGGAYPSHGPATCHLITG